MNKKIIIGVIALTFLGIIIVMAKNNNQQSIPNAGVASETANEIQSSNIKNSVDKIEIYYFHRTQRCYSCNILSQYTREIIEQKFSEEIKNGKIEFREVNVDLPENKNTALKFQASGSSLFVNVIKDGQDDINQDANVWQLLNNRSQFENYLTNKINSLLDK
ncbi:MAG: hypothetical protein KAQ87_01760 [Candidatus Pacebacteria bacterium]|nr:hypothetical protein [Candidatus Paceibacterota bacterium]